MLYDMGLHPRLCNVCPVDTSGGGGWKGAERLSPHLADVAHLGDIADNVANLWAHGLPQLLFRQHAAVQGSVQQRSSNAVLTGFQICQDLCNLSTAYLQMQMKMKPSPILHRCSGNCYGGRKGRGGSADPEQKQP